MRNSKSRSTDPEVGPRGAGRGVRSQGGEDGEVREGEDVCTCSKAM